MSTLSAQEQRQRSYHFDGPILHVANHNAAVRRIVTEYSIGAIITKEEALSQMVVALAKDWSQEADRAMNLSLRMGMGFAKDA